MAVEGQADPFRNDWFMKSSPVWYFIGYAIRFGFPIHRPCFQISISKCIFEKSLYPGQEDQRVRAVPGRAGRPRGLPGERAGPGRAEVTYINMVGYHVVYWLVVIISIMLHYYLSCCHVLLWYSSLYILVYLSIVYHIILYHINYSIVEYSMI